VREQAEVARQRRRLAKLKEEREKLLHAYYAGAVPVDLLRSEQDRLTSETRQAERHLEALHHECPLVLLLPLTAILTIWPNK
jgi:hypothetical protein